MLIPCSWNMEEIPEESVRKSPGLFDFKTFINRGTAASFRYSAIFLRKATCSSCRGPGMNFVSVSILVLIGGVTLKSI